MTGLIQHTFDAELAGRRRDDALARVHEHARPAWRHDALRAIYDLCRTRSEFTTDAVWALLDRRLVLVPHEPRALGAIMRMASARGWCHPTGEVRKSTRAECHGRPLTVWVARQPLPEWDPVT